MFKNIFLFFGARQEAEESVVGGKDCRCHCGSGGKNRTGVYTSTTNHRRTQKQLVDKPISYS